MCFLVWMGLGRLVVLDADSLLLLTGYFSSSSCGWWDGVLSREASGFYECVEWLREWLSGGGVEGVVIPSGVLLEVLACLRCSGLGVSDVLDVVAGVVGGLDRVCVFYLDDYLVFSMGYGLGFVEPGGCPVCMQYVLEAVVAAMLLGAVLVTFSRSLAGRARSVGVDVCCCGLC